MSELVTVVETNAYANRANRLLPDDLRLEIAAHLAADPEYGELMEGTGGCRKARFALPGRGKRGSVRIVHVRPGRTLPVFLIALFAKNEKSNLTKRERNTVRGLVKTLKDTYGAIK